MKFYNLGPEPVQQKRDEFVDPPLTFRLSADGGKLTGTMSFDGNDLVFELRRGTAPATLPDKQWEDRTQQPVWTFKTGAAIWSPPSIDEDAVYFGSNDGNVYALKASTGKEVWRFKTGGWVMGQPTVDGRYIYVLSDDGLLYKLDKQKGKKVWAFDTHGGNVKRDMPPEHMEYDSLTSGATVVSGMVYIGSADGRLYAVDARTGSEKWHFETKDIVRSTPAVSEGTVFFGSRDHNVYALDNGTGLLKWKFDTFREVVSSPLVADHTVFIGSRDSNLFALDTATGNVKWKFFYWSSWVESSARVYDNTLYIGSSDYQQVFAIDSASGRKLWNFDTDGSAWSTPAVTNKAIYVGAVGLPKVDYIKHHGAFFAIDRASGKLLWRYPMKPISGSGSYGVASSPAVGRGLVFFGGLDGLFYAFRSEK